MSCTSTRETVLIHLALSFPCTLTVVTPAPSNGSGPPLTAGTISGWSAWPCLHPLDPNQSALPRTLTPSFPNAMRV